MVLTSKGYVVTVGNLQLTEHLLDGREIQRSLLKKVVHNKQLLEEVCIQSVGLLFMTPIQHN
jgi:hypothetical protein